MTFKIAAILPTTQQHLTEFKKKVSDYWREHPTVYKVCLVCDHIIIRMSPCAASLALLPYSFPVNCTINFAMSTFYWLTVEQDSCSFSFVYPALVGAITLQFSDEALLQLISGVAFKSFDHLTVALLGVSPFLLYTLGVIVLTNMQVNARLKKECCMKKELEQVPTRSS